MNRRTITATQAELLCKNGCGFYGNPSWEGYCSKCWKERDSSVAAAAASNIRKLANHAQQLHSAAKKQDSTKPKNEGSKMGFEFDRFERRRGQKEERKTKAVKSIFKVPKPKRLTSPKSAPVPSKPQGESQQVGGEFAEFLRVEMEKKAALDVSKQVRAFIDKFVARVEATVSEQSEMVQDFYAEFQDRLAANPVYRSVSEEKAERLLDFLEKYLMTRLYRIAFNNPLADDEAKDLKLQDKIRSLNWVTASMLETGINEKDAKVRGILDDAVSAIIEMDSKRAPADKLKTLATSSKLIFDALFASTGKPASADAFLPSLIFLLLQSNPPLLRSNISFISRFSLPQRVREGEAAYYYVNLCIAADFIADKFDAEALNMTDNEFRRHMSGELTPEASEFRLESGYSCEGLRLMHHDLIALRELKERNVRGAAERAALRAEIAAWVTSVTNNVDAILARTPLDLRGPSISGIDDENPSVEGLASPLIPSVVMGGGEAPPEWNGEGDGGDAGAAWAFGASTPRQTDDAVAATYSLAVTDSPGPPDNPAGTPSSTGSPVLGSLRSKNYSYDSLDLLEANLDSDDDFLGLDRNATAAAVETAAAESAAASEEGDKSLL